MMPSVDLFRRAEDLGITAVMRAPWAGTQDVQAGDGDTFKQPAERYRASIERFAEAVIEKCR
jgi:hypothetical protein